MRFVLLGLTVALMLIGTALVIASLPSRDETSALGAMTGMIVTIIAAIPAVVYATITS